MLARNLFILLVLLVPTLSFADADMTGALWTNLAVSGHLGRRDVPYLVEVHGRFLSNSELFDRGKLRLGIGLRTTKQASFWLGYDLVPNKITSTARFDIQQRTWQQFYWFSPIADKNILTIRTRLEQRYSSLDSAVAWRVRQKASFVLVDASDHTIGLTMSDELHVNINHPDWIPNKLVNQNRFSVSLLFSTGAHTDTQIGYMHQLKFRDPRDETVHVLFITMHVLTGLKP